MEFNQVVKRWMGIAGLLGGVSLISITLLMGNTFGYPGSEEYQIYQTKNRLTSISLLLASFGFIGFYPNRYITLPRAGKIAGALTAIGLTGMVVGNAAEFWLFSDLPYNQPNMRNVSFGIFVLGGLLMGIASLIGGVVFWRLQNVPRWIALLLILYLPSLILWLLPTGMVAAILGRYVVRKNSQQTAL